MGYEIDFGLWGGIFAVPTALADRHLKLCSEAQLKVLLLALRDAPNPVDVRYIAKRLGMDPHQVCDCLDYWQGVGLFTPSDAAPATPAAEKPAAETAPTAAPDATITQEPGVGKQKITTVRSRTKLTPAQITEMSKGDKNIPQLLQELQQLLGKPLSPAHTESVVYTYSYFELSPAFILMVAEYCKSIGKPNIAYINQVIANWVENGIDTHDRAETHIKALADKSSNEALVQTLFGITGRSLSPKEKQYIDNWFNLLGYGMDMIELAYYRTVDNTGKAAFGYTNTILTRWKEKGIETVAAAKAEMESGSKKAKAAKGGDTEEKSFDLDEIQRLMALRSGGQDSDS